MHLRPLACGIFARHRTYELSIGQQKKIAIARAIVTSPPVLIADEATANLDNRSAMDIMKLFNKINRRDDGRICDA